MKPRRGRPPRADKAATERIEIRVTRLERAAWEHAAAQAGITVSEWIRRHTKTLDRYSAALRTIRGDFPTVLEDLDHAERIARIALETDEPIP